MEEVKSKLHYLKSKILQYSEIPDNIRLELSNDIFKVEQALTIHGVIVSDFCECTYIRHKDTWTREDGKVICCHCHLPKQK